MTTGQRWQKKKRISSSVSLNLKEIQKQLPSKLLPGIFSTANNITINYYLVESSVTLGDCSRAKKSTYVKMKHCTSSIGITSNISSDSSHLNIDQPNIADISTELSERLKASDLDDKTEGQETGFRFNFKVDSMATSSTKNVSEEVISKPEANNSQHPKLSCKGLKYAASDNSFRFNFPS